MVDLVLQKRPISVQSPNVLPSLRLPDDMTGFHRTGFSPGAMFSAVARRRITSLVVQTKS